MKDCGYAVHDVVTVQVVKIHEFGALVRLPNKKLGLIHISQVADEFVTNVGDYLKVGDTVTARVKKISADGKVDLTLKTRRTAPAAGVSQTKIFRVAPFEEKLDAFLKRSSESNAGGMSAVRLDPGK